MAALITAKRSIALSKAFQNLLSSPARPLAASGRVIARSFNTNAQIREPEDDRDLEIDRRPGEDAVYRRRADGFPAQLSDVMDPFVPRTVSQLLNMMDSMFDRPFTSAARGTGGLRRGWDAREDNDALCLRMDMPGLGKENVKVSAEQGTLFINGEGEAEAGDEESHRRYSTRIDLAPELYKLDAIRAEMKNGVLKVIVPKVKQEERKDVFHVNID
ncbi:small heat shock protein, chloroplastic-like [Dendrobium catenatum]|uniref:Small heat shock protein, chloroplastic n=1 Tax=Dendrobium catenatum TaxID=906689 RepID=A0A2I0WXP6_9ASPA|nr:small heat shock protein, chloroplastic-like [Dendrobium catenatum]PKU80431.1 Small heat shock protein, chloroplastic [Dendrobium catenatum]